jgi:hypothetical protein
MSDADEAVVIGLVNFVQLLKGLRNASFRSLAQSRAAFRQLHSFLTSSNLLLSPTGVSAEHPQMKAFREALNPVPLFLGFAGTALLYLQQQQRCILQALAADLTFVIMICESLASAIQMQTSTPDSAIGAQQLLRDAAPGEHCRRMLLWQVLQLYTRGCCRC